MSDWIEDFLAYTEGIPSPDIFRLWAAISTIAGALERRVFVWTRRSALYPNMFNLLVAPPAVGKSQAIFHTQDLWLAANQSGFHIAPDNVSRASLIDALAEATTKRVVPESNSIIEYNTLLVAAGELGVLIPAHDLDFLSVLAYLYDCPKYFRERKRGNNLQLEITHPQLTILAGTQPGFMAEVIPETAWNMGFMSRIIMVYAGSTPYVSIFENQELRADLRADLAKRLGQMSKLMGGFHFTPEAKEDLEAWAKGGAKPIPEHSKLVHYCGRRVLHVLKLAMVSSASRGPSLIIEHSDIQRARQWLLEAEERMPDVFREMTGRSDAVVIQEFHYFLWQIWVKERKPIHEARLFNFLKSHVPSEKIQKIIDICQSANIIQRLAGTETYIPKPKHEHGVE